MKRVYTGDEIRAMDLHDWRSIHEYLQTRFLTGDFATGLEFVNRIGHLAEQVDHHPDIDLRYRHVTIKLMSHDVFAKTDRDLDLARKISAVAHDMGITSAPETSARIEIALDTWDVSEIRPFWIAVLGLSPHPKFAFDLRDRDGDLPSLWFQECEQHAPPTQRFHLDIRLPPEVAWDRIAAALAVGGEIVGSQSGDLDPRRAGSFTVLADPQGNKVCVCVHHGRAD